MFINRERSPTTCCFGCTLTCSMINYVVFQSFGLITAIIHFNVFWILFGLANIVPVVCLYFYNDSVALRRWNVIQQCISLCILIGFLVYTFSHISSIMFLACYEYQGFAHIGSCVKDGRPAFYFAFFFLSGLALMLQVMWVRLFKVYHDELAEIKSDKLEYSELPQTETV